jgi:multiple sugar transport system substrate-binding protein
MIQLSGITWDHPRGYAPLVAAQSRYATTHGVDVAWRKRSLKDFGDASLESLAEQFDLLVIDHPHMGVAHEARCLLPYDVLLPGGSLAAMRGSSAGLSFESYHYAGQQWALPIDAACQVAAYRPDLLDASDLPKTWDEVYTLAEKLHQRDQSVGMALCPTDSLCSFLTLCAQSGDAPQEGRGKLAEDATVLRVLEQLKRLKEICHPDCLQSNPIRLFDTMATAESSLVYAPLAFGYTNYSRIGYAPRALRFTTIPDTHRALLGGAGIAISAHCTQPKAAAAYAAWLYSDSYQKNHYTRDGGQPGNAAAWRDSEADNLTGGFFSGTWATIQEAYTRPRHPGWPQFQEYLGDRVHAYLAKGGDPSGVVSDLQRAYLKQKLNRSSPENTIL